MDKWVLHELNEKPKKRLLGAELMLLSHHKFDSFSNQIVTCDEKWNHMTLPNFQHSVWTSMAHSKPCNSSKEAFDKRIDI